MRDIRKNQDYFNAYLEYQYLRIEKKTAQLKESFGDKKQRILLSLTGYEVDLLKAEFSSGASKDNLKTLLIRAIEIVKDYENITYEDLLVLVSLSVILNVEQDAKKLIQKNSKKIESDRLLKFITSFIEDGKGVWENRVSLVKEYSLLDNVFNESDKEKAMLNYLNHWYENHSEYAWYDAHIRDTDTYCGYWSFEAAAILKILGLSCDKVKESEYYPQI